MKKLLITGGLGYIGTAMIRHFRNKYDIIVVDSLRYNQYKAVYPILDGIEFVHGDVRDSSLLAPLVESADIIFPLAALVGAPLCEKCPTECLEVNLRAVEDLLKLAQHDQIIVFPNTNSGYGDAGGKLCTEETPLKAISLYGDTKDRAEQAVLKYHNSVVFRLATVFGYAPRMRTDLLVNTLVKDAVYMGGITVFDDAYMRNYIHIKDICRAFDFAVESIDNMRGQVYNLGNDKVNMTKGDLALTIRKYIPYLPVVTSLNKTDPDKRNYLVSSAKLYGLGWKPKYSLDDGIEELIHYYKHGYDPLQQGIMSNV